MAFLIYHRTEVEGRELLSKTSEEYSLSGYNLIRTSWELKGKPINRGWSVEVDELIRLKTGGNNNYISMRFLIDFHPGAKKRIGIIELLRIHGFTFGDEEAHAAYWTPIMIIGRDVYYQEFDQVITVEEKERIIREFNDPDYGEPFVEFLYLKGDEEGWKWGANGRTNAAFIYGDAREYFREFF